jgi:DNA-nicking Smr family endonuclease
MDFGKILDDWDSYQKRERKAQKEGKKNPPKSLGPKPNPGPRDPSAQGTSRASSRGTSSVADIPVQPAKTQSAKDRIESPKSGASPGTNRGPGPNDYLNHWLVLHGTQDKDSDASEAADDRQARIRNAERLHRLAPQATIDLHGKTAVEAENDLSRFLAACAKEGLEKVLIIHGKGNHSENEGIMTSLVRRVLENSDLAASFGFEDRQHGGRGATWVILRKKDYFSR